MSFLDCIKKAFDDGRLSEATYRQARSLFDEAELELQNTMHASQAQIEASRRAFDAVRMEKLESARRRLLQATTWSRVVKNLKSYRNAKGEIDLPAAILAHLDRDEFAPFSNVEARRKAILGRLHGHMTEVLATFRLNVLGQVREKATLQDVVREVFGQDSGNAAAKELATAWKKSAEIGRQRFNAAGGHIGKRDDWGMPQMHDARAVRNTSFQEWRDFILPRLDSTRMIDERTGQPFAPEALQLALRDVYETIRTDGLNKVKLNGTNAGASMANRWADHRFLVFKNADGWMSYNDRFGVSDVFSTMMGHLDGMSRDIAAMEILGPNPTATLRFMDQMMEKAAGTSDLVGKESDKALNRVSKASHLLWNMWGNYTGSVNAPVDGKIAAFFTGTRQVLQAAQLGAATLSAVTDMNFQRLARSMAGLKQTNILPQYTKLLKPGNLEDQKIAVRLGLIAENWSQHASALNRYVGETNGPEIARRLADFTLRMSGLSPWTQAGRWAFGMEFAGALADHAGMAFKELPAALQKTLQRYGIETEHWDIIRTTELMEHEGATFLRAEDIANRTDIAPALADDLGLKVLEMIQAETEFAVPSASLRGRAMLKGDTRPGTWRGELLRSAAMYKNFAVTLAHTHMMRTVAQDGWKSKAGYAANLIISTTLMGGFALQLKEISKGRDPKPMGSASFWGSALLQGGGLGIFGDFLFSDVNRFDQSLGESVAGPVFSFANDIRKLTIGNAIELAQGENTNFAKETIDFVKRYGTPGIKNWYTQLALERGIFDQVQKWVDPQATARFARTKKRWLRESNQRFWWQPGEATPDRAPDISNALEESK